MDEQQPQPQQGYTFDPQPPPRPNVGPQVAPPMSAMQAMPRPLPVTLSFWSWLVATLVAMLTALAALTEFDRMKTQLIELAREQDASVRQATLGQVALYAIAILIGLGVLIALLQFGAAALMHAGRNWARTTLIPLALLGLVYGLVLVGGLAPEALGPVYDLVRLGLVVYLVLVIVSTIVMLLPGARPWFERPQPSEVEDYL